MPTLVLHVIARMNLGGTARYVGELLENVPNCKLATGFVQGSEVEDKNLEKFSVIRIKFMGRKISIINDFLAFLELRRIIRQVRPSIVHTHTFKAGLIGRLIPGRHKKVHTFHGHLFDDPSFSLFEKSIITTMERFLAKRTDVLVSVGKEVGAELRNKGIGPRQDWVSIPPGLNALPTFEKLQARRNLGLQSDGILVGWMARMAAVKNPLLLLKIASQLPEIDFVMAGDGDLFEMVRAHAPKNVKLLGWADAAIFWSAVDLAVSTSENEGMPIALIEAQMAGLPVIATNVGSTSEVIENGITGYVTSGEVGDIVEAIVTLTSDSNLLIKMGNAARTRAEDEFSLEKMLNKHRQLYFDLVNVLKS
jgi:glycosyltransferase involved in cell wall biosynthesis